MEEYCNLTREYLTNRGYKVNSVKYRDYYKSNGIEAIVNNKKVFLIYNFNSIEQLKEKLKEI